MTSVIFCNLKRAVVWPWLPNHLFRFIISQQEFEEMRYTIGSISTVVVYECGTERGSIKECKSVGQSQTDHTKLSSKVMRLVPVHASLVRMSHNETYGWTEQKCKYIYDCESWTACNHCTVLSPELFDDFSSHHCINAWDSGKMKQVLTLLLLSHVGSKSIKNNSNKSQIWSYDGQHKLQLSVIFLRLPK